jgi:hypothetical protein
VPDPRPYEVYAIKYGDHQRRASENFLGGDPHRDLEGIIARLDVERQERA